MTIRPLRDWEARHLLLAWAAYWLVLVLAVLGPPAWLVWRVTSVPHGHGSVSAGFTNTTLGLTVAQDGATRWTGSASLLVIALWLVLPPLLLTLVWLRTRPDRRADAGRLTSDADTRGAALAAGERPGADARVDARDRAPVP